MDIKFYNSFNAKPASEKENIRKIISNLKILKNEHKYDNDQISAVILKMNLDFGRHLYITGNFSKLCEFIN